MKYLTLILSLALFLGLSGCSDDKPVQRYAQPYASPQQYIQHPQYAPVQGQYAQPQPGYAQPYREDNGIGMGSVLAAGVAGAVLGNMAGDKGHSVIRIISL